MKIYIKNRFIAALIIFLLSFNLMNVYLTKITVNAELKNEIHSNKSLKKIPAFYDAEGGGMWATGARGAENPEIYHVTNLNDSGSGSFRDAVSKGDRFIIFDVGGNIKLKTPIKIKNISNLTILGQTAPGEGISIENEEISIDNSSNIIMRYLRIRTKPKAKDSDTLTITQSDNIIVDHCSMSWSIDECANLIGVKDSTIQWCIISEALNNSLHSEGAHSMGAMWGGINLTAHHNLLVSNKSRNPAIATGSGTRTYKNSPDTDAIINVRNNVIYNWGGEGYGGHNGTRINFIGNYYKPGPGTKESAKNIIFNIMGTPNTSKSLPENGGTLGGGKGVRGWSATMYLEDNYIEGADDVTADNWKGIKIDLTVGSYEGSYIKCKNISDGVYVDGVLKANDEYLDEYPIITQNPNTAYNEVLKYAGTSIKRDSIDTRVVNDVINKTAPTGSISGLGFIDSPDDVGGFIVLDGGVKESDLDNDGIPDIWEEKNGLDKTNPHDSLKISEDSYTMLEKYGEELAVHNNETRADKSELRETIYSVLKMNKYDYSLKSWNDLQAVLNNAKETVSVVYANQIDIDIACENLKKAVASLKPENKYNLRVEIEKAKELDSYLYTENSYKNLINAIESAELIYNDENFLDTDVNNAIQTLKNAIDNLEFNYRNMLNKLVEKAVNEDQVSYTFESMETLLEKIQSSKELLQNPNAANYELKIKYEQLKSAYDSLNKETDVYSRFTGDFENLICYRVKDGYHGKFILKSDDAICEIKKNIGGNPTNALLINDNSPNRTSIIHRLSEKLEGTVSVCADYYFENEPQSYNILLRLSDSDLTDNGSGIFLNLNTKREKSKVYLSVDNSGDITNCIDMVFEKGKWYNIKVVIDTYKKEYTIYINKKEIQSGIITAAVSEKSDFGVISYQIATPGGNKQTLALDNLKTEIIGDKDTLKELIDKVKLIDSKMYTSKSYSNVLNKLELAEKEYNKLPFAQGDDIKTVIEELKIAINDLERNGLGYELNELVNKVSIIDQMNYTKESVENLANYFQSAKESLKDIYSTNEKLQNEYTKLNAAYSALVESTDNSRISGDFENLSCIGIGIRGEKKKYGKYRYILGNNICDIRKNIGGNTTNALWIDTTVSSERTWLEYTLAENFISKVSGLINIEADYYFEKKPTGITLLLRLTDNNFDGNILNFLDISIVNSCLRINHLNKDINDFTNVVFQKGKWYKIKTEIDTINRKCVVYVDNNEVAKVNLKYIPSESELGISRYSISTSGDNIMVLDNIKSEIAGDINKLKYMISKAKELNSKIYTDESYKKLENIVEFSEKVCNGLNSLQADEIKKLYETLSAAIDTVKVSVKDKGCKFINYEFKGEWIPSGIITIKGDIVNYESEKENLLLIIASFENGTLIDSNLKEITANELSSIDNIISDIKLGNDIAKCKIKVFLWRNNLEPLMYLEKSKK